MAATSKEIVFQGSNIVVGKFHCPPNHELWSVENCTGDWPSIAFPRVAVGIKQANHAEVVATPNHVMFYNSFHPYHRQLLDPRGDECEFFSVSGNLLAEITDLAGPEFDRSMETPFRFSHAICPADVYLTQRAMFQQLQSPSGLDPLFVEEQYIGLFHKLVDGDGDSSKLRLMHSKDHCPWQRQQIGAAKRYIAKNYCQNLKVEDVASSVDCSLFHFCRLFKKFAGVTVHRFLTQCRLRSAIERLMDTDRSILNISLDLGFSSQSHFTSSFQQSFGLSPGVLRATRGANIPGRNQ